MVTRPVGRLVATAQNGLEVLRLGGLETKTAINHLLEGNKRNSFKVLLQYYDKHYLKGLNNRPNTAMQVLTIESPVVDAASNVTRLLNKNQTISLEQ